MTKYLKIKNYDATEIDHSRNEMFRFACCDCGMVHTLGIAPVGNNRIRIAFRRENRITAQLRRYNYGDLQQGKHTNYRMLRKEG